MQRLILGISLVSGHVIFLITYNTSHIAPVQCNFTKEQEYCKKYRNRNDLSVVAIITDSGLTHVERDFSLPLL